MPHDREKDPDSDPDRTSGDELNGDFSDFASAMKGVEPLSKGKQTLSPPVPKTAAEQQVRRKAAEEFQSEEDESNFLTLGEVKLRDPLDALEWRHLSTDPQSPSEQLALRTDQPR